MKAMKPFYFAHPQYGKLRVVVIDGKIYYCLMDVKNIFKKSVQKLYETIADSEGELKNLNIVMMKDMKIKYGSVPSCRRFPPGPFRAHRCRSMRILSCAPGP